MIFSLYSYLIDSQLDTKRLLNLPLSEKDLIILWSVNPYDLPTY